jgi:hypothetical protein
MTLSWGFRAFGRYKRWIQDMNLWRKHKINDPSSLEFGKQNDLFSFLSILLSICSQTCFPHFELNWLLRLNYFDHLEWFFWWILDLSTTNHVVSVR